MSRRAPSWLATQPGDVYTLHFWPPYGDPAGQHAGHYTGWAREGRLGSRLVDHALGRGARLTQVQLRAGGSWGLADVEAGVTRGRQTPLKERRPSPRGRLCPAQAPVQEGRLPHGPAL